MSARSVCTLITSRLPASRNFAHSSKDARRNKRKREIGDLEERIDSAVVIERAGSTEGVSFGAKVTIELPDKSRQTYGIIGEDEADPLHGSISWLSPLAQALMDRKWGESVVWQRPAGNVNVRIIKIE